MTANDPAAAAVDLAPAGTLRAGINLGNPLLVTGQTADGDPVGVSPDLAAALAAELGVPLSLVSFPTPGAVADAAVTDAWDVGLIAAEPARAETIDFTAPYTEIEATYMVPVGSPLTAVDQVDRDGVRIAVSERSAFDLYLTRTLKHATLHRIQGLQASLELFLNEKLEALAGLRPGLLEKADAAGGTVLDGRFTTVNQAIGVPKGRPTGSAFVRQFVEDAKASGLIADLIDRHDVAGKLLVAPAAV